MADAQTLIGENAHTTIASPTDDTETRLRNDIAAMLEQKLDATGKSKPPFSTVELVIIAAVMSGKRCISVVTIAEWIQTNLLYYNCAPIVAHRPKIIKSICECPYEDVVPGFYETTLRWDMPWIHHHKQASCDSELSEKYHETSWLVTVDTNAARTVLTRLLVSRSGVFRFMNLPAELRVRAYEYALSVRPIKGLGGSHWPSRCSTSYRRVLEEVVRVDAGLYVYSTRDPTDADGSTGQDSTGDEGLARLDSAPVQDSFALFGVSRQLKKEAVPVFYDINKFVCKDLKGLCSMSTLAPARIQWITHLELHYKMPTAEELTTKDIVTALNQFLEIEELKTLTMWASDEEIFIVPYTAKPKVVKISGLAYRDFEELCEMAAEAAALDIRGTCPHFTRDLRGKVQRLGTGAGAGRGQVQPADGGVSA